ncbi:Gfo/Idh/MocA family protein [Paenibacillus koleovorans]|uniref:Gfo/Idh/MocA family protein n=1 Tax=Paenibacillus koleovorans TaxID=121608 RepID=UPI000FD8EF81|nr:Gfo/Idh/MocA family oxidoreductase [Paenibacillus koleovorans]
MENQAKFRVAMIGAGGRANAVIYPALASLPDVEIAAICDIDPAALAKTADKYNVDRRYGESIVDYQRMIQEVKPDAVFAIGQPHLQYDIWMWCLRRGVNLYVEKPLGLTIHQARALALVAQQNGSITQVSFQRRSTPMVAQLREECLKRGPIVHAVCRFYKSEMKPYLGARDRMMDDCVHSIDTLRWICGGEIAKIESHCKKVQTPDINFISATLHFDNGATGYLINSWSSGRRIFSVEMHAPNICAEAEHENKGYLYADGDTKGIEFDTRQIAESNESYAYTGVKEKCREFVDCCREGRQPGSHFGDAVKTMEVAEIILAQSLLAERRG